VLAGQSGHCFCLSYAALFTFDIHDKSVSRGDGVPPSSRVRPVNLSLNFRSRSSAGIVLLSSGCCAALGRTRHSFAVSGAFTITED
jgi:hypothetical protein